MNKLELARLHPFSTPKRVLLGTPDTVVRNTPHDPRTPWNEVWIVTANGDGVIGAQGKLTETAITESCTDRRPPMTQYELAIAYEALRAIEQHPEDREILEMALGALSYYFATTRHWRIALATEKEDCLTQICVHWPSVKQNTKPKNQGIILHPVIAQGPHCADTFRIRALVEMTLAFQIRNHPHTVPKRLKRRISRN